MSKKIKEPSLHNRKPYRTKAQRLEARATAYKSEGTWKSTAPVSYHPAPKKGEL